MADKQEILKKRFYKLDKHLTAFGEYHQLIEEMLEIEDVLSVEKFNFIAVKDSFSTLKSYVDNAKQFVKGYGYKTL